jgi:hypothetical protein
LIPVSAAPQPSPVQTPPTVPSAPKTPLSVAVQPAYGHTFIVLLLTIMSGYALRIWSQNARDFGTPAPQITTAPVILVPAAPAPAPTPPIQPAPVAPPAKPDPPQLPTGPSPAAAPPVALAVKDDSDEMIGGYPKYKPGRDGQRLTLTGFESGHPVYRY